MGVEDKWKDAGQIMQKIEWDKQKKSGNVKSWRKTRVYALVQLKFSTDTGFCVFA